MPEGDTIPRVATTLHRVLAGRQVTAFESPLADVDYAARRRGIVGSHVEAVEARGKHLLVSFSSGAVLHTHQRMHGSWHLYRAGSRWRRPGHEMRVRIDAGDVSAVCFASPVVELLTSAEVARHPVLSRLGPDLLAPDFDAAAAKQRLLSRGSAPIGVALMDQSALAGIGNVYKSEILFLCAVDPFAPLAALDDTALDRVLGTAAVQMRRNLTGGQRRTTSPQAESPLWVYRRAGRPCRRCGTRIASRRQGDEGRTTYWCPQCQPPITRSSPS
jgi:endonuclease-8